MIETWGEMRDRHAMEKAEAIMSLASKGLTQTEASKVLGASLSEINYFVRHNNLHWPTIRQGTRSRDLSKILEPTQ